MPDPTAVIYSDGSGPFDGNGGWANILSYAGTEPVISYGFTRKTTIWRCEFAGILDALYTLSTIAKGRCRIFIVSDSQALCKCLTGEYQRPAAGQDMFAAYRNLVSGHEVTVTWAARRSNPYMKLVDSLAYAVTKAIHTGFNHDIANELSQLSEYQNHDAFVASVKELAQR